MPIYKITNTITGDFYIGKTQLSSEQRFINHKYASRYYDSHLYRAFKKYGLAAFEVSVIESCDTSILNERERFWISELRPHYNMTSGGDGGPTHHLESWKRGVARRRSFSGEGNPMFGKESAFKGKPHTTESIDLMKSAAKDVWSRMTADERAARGKKVSGKANGMYGKTPTNAIQYEYNGVVYKSLAAAERETGKSAYFIKMNGKRVYDDENRGK